MEVFNRLARGAEAAIKVDDGDYIQDGLLMCGKCHTKKQTRITVFESERTVFCLCKCEAEKRKAEDDAWERERKERRIRNLRLYGIPAEEMQQWTFEKDDKANPKLTSWARCYVSTFPAMLQRGQGVVLYGPTGTGKTFAAACVANALIDQGRPVLMTSFSRIRNILQNESDRQGYLDDFAKYELLVIDDLGAESDSSYMEEIVYNVIDARYRQHKPIIVTTNYDREQINFAEDVTKKRIFSRLFEMCTFLAVEGKDRRRALNRENVKAAEKEWEDLF